MCMDKGNYWRIKAIESGDYADDRFIRAYRDCSDIACILSERAMKELREQIKELEIW